jgi:PleD family two-component response regulator
MPRLQQGYEVNEAENMQYPNSEKIALKVEFEFQTMKQVHIKDDDTDRSGDNRQYSVLVVDDNYEVCSLVESMLIDTYFIFKAYDGESALIY